MAAKATWKHRLETGPGMRVQRGIEGAFLVAAFITGDARFAHVTLASTVLQALSPWLVPVALAVAAVHRHSSPPRMSDLYFDMTGGRGACAISTVVQAAGLWLIHSGPAVAGWMILTVPTASFLLAPAAGFCAGCTFYVWFRDAFARIGLSRRTVDGIRDFDVETVAADRQ